MWSSAVCGQRRALDTPGVGDFSVDICAMKCLVSCMVGVSEDGLPHLCFTVAGIKVPLSVVVEEI